MKSQLAGIILFSFILIFVISFGNQTTFATLPESATPISYTNVRFVDVTNGNNNWNGEFETYQGDNDGPWASITHASSMVSSGYLVNVAAGTYSERVLITSSGSSGDFNDIKYQANGEVIVDGTDVGIYVCGHNYNTFDGFSITSCSDYGIYIFNSSQNNKFENCEIDDCDDVGVKVETSNLSIIENVTINEINSSDGYGIIAQGSSGNEVTGLIINNCIIKDGKSAIYLAGYCNSTFISNNLIIDEDYNLNYYGIHVTNNCNFTQIYGNEVKNEITYSNNRKGIYINNSCNTSNIYDNRIYGQWYYGIQIEGENAYINVYKNRIFTTGTSGLYIIDNNSNCKFYNNMICGEYSESAVFDRDNQEGFEYYYNTFKNITTDSYKHSYYGRRQSVDYRLSGFQNNLLYSNTSYGPVIYISNVDSADEEYWRPTANFSNNCYYGGTFVGYYGDYGNAVSAVNWRVAVSGDPNCIDTDPKFRIETSAYIKSTSTCISSAYPNTSYTTDIDGEIRDASNPDIGADEYINADIYYVRPDGNDSNNGNGSDIENAWLTLTNAISFVEAGDTIYVAPGTYSEEVIVTALGSYGDWINIIADTDASEFPVGEFSQGDVIIDGDSHGIYCDGESGGDINPGDDECGYILFNGFTITGCTDEGIYVKHNCHNLEFYNIDLSNPGTANDKAVICLLGQDISEPNPEYVEISDCVIKHGKYGIKITDYCEYIEISNNQIIDFVICGLYVSNHCNNGIVYNNQITVETAAYQENGIDFNDYNENWNIYNNMVSGEFINPAVADTNNGPNFDWRFNSISNLSSQITSSAYNGSRSSLGNNVRYFLNNILKVHEDAESIIHIANIGNYWKPAYYNLDYNCYYGSQVSFGNFSPTGGTSGDCLDINMWISALELNESGSSLYDSHSIVADPDYISNTNLHLQSTSPCFARGIYVSSIIVDMDGNSRAYNRPYIGADELSIASIDFEIDLDSSQTIDSVTISNSGTININDTSVGSDTSVLTVNNLTIDSGGTINLNDDCELVVKDTLIVNGVIYVNDCGKITARSLTINTSGMIDASGKGYIHQDGPGEGGDGTGGGGGAYGDDGGDGLNSIGGIAADYNDNNLFYYPNKEKGSGGGNANGGSGGGSINIEVTCDLTINYPGCIRANGEIGGDNGGGGAGGGILIVADTISYTGSGDMVFVNGGAGGNGNCGGGGGGLVAIYSHNIQSGFSNNVNADGGSGSGSGQSGNAGKKEIKELAYQCQKCVVCELPNSAYVSIPGDNSNVSLISGCATSEFYATYLSSSDSVSRNFSYYYNTRSAITSATSPFGCAGWTHGFNETLDIDNPSDPQQITYTMMCGKQVVFQKRDLGELGIKYITPPFFGPIGELTIETTPTKYVITKKNGSRRVFDSDGKWTSLSDSNGNTMELNYDVSNNLEYVEFPDGRCIKIEYNTVLGESRPKYVKCFESGSLTNQIGETYTFNYCYDDTGIGVMISSAGDWSFNYTTESSITKLTKMTQAINASDSRETEYTYENLPKGIVQSVKNNDDVAVSFSYSPIDHTTIVTDRNGKEWEYEWNQLFDTVTGMKNPNGNQWIKEYDEYRNLIKKTSPKFNNDYQTIYKYEYDLNRNLVEEKIGDSSDPDFDDHYIKSTYEYDVFNNKISKYGPYAKHPVDAFNTTEYGKTKVEYIYDCDGTISVANGSSVVNGSNTHFLTDCIVGGYIAIGFEYHKISTITSDTLMSIAGSWSFTYNGVYTSSRRNLKQIKEQLTSTPTYFITQYDYDANGKVVKVFEHKGNAKEIETQYVYATSTNYTNGEIKGRLKQVILDPSGVAITTSYKYYEGGYLRELINPNGRIDQFIYDEKGKQVASCYDVGVDKYNSCSIVEYNYDGSVVSIKRGKASSWVTSSKTYAIANEPWTKVEYQYDSCGRLKCIASDVDHTATTKYLGTVKTYNSAGQVIKVMSGEVANFGNSSVIINTYGDRAYTETQYEYYDNGKIYKVKSLLEGSTYTETEYSYWDNGNIYEIVGPKYDTSNRMKFRYKTDYAGRLSQVRTLYDASDSWNEMTMYYNDHGDIEKIVNPEGNETEYSYYTYTNRLKQIAVDPNNLNLKTYFDYNDFGQTEMTTYAYGTGDAVYAYTAHDDLGRIVKQWLGDNDSRAFGDNESINKVQYYYDDLSRVYKTELFDIDDTGNQLYDNVFTETVYDAFNRVIASCFDPDSDLKGSVISYDELGRVYQSESVIFTAFSGYSQTYSYTTANVLMKNKSIFNDAGQLENRILNPDDASDRLEDITSYYEYDELGRIIFVNDPEQWYQNGSRQKNSYNNTMYEYDNAGRLLKVKATVDGTLRTLNEYTYYDNGARKQLKYTQDGTSFATVNYGCYPTGQLAYVEYPGYSGTDRYDYTYTQIGAIDTIEVNSSEKFDYSYDNAGRVTSNGDLSLTYNNRSQVTDIDQGANEMYTIDYDEYGRVSKTNDKTYGIFDTTNQELRYSYYKNSLLKDTYLYTGDVVNTRNKYYKDGLLKELLRWDGNNWDKIASYEYNSLGQRISYTRFKDNGGIPECVAHTVYQYKEHIGWLQSVENRDDNDGTYNVLSGFYYYENNHGDKNDLVGNRLYTRFGTERNSNYFEYSYDSLYRLIEEEYFDSNDQQIYKYNWTYDWAGNRLTQKQYVSNSETNFWEYDYNTGNQLIEQRKYNQEATPRTQEAGIEYSYNPSGYLTQKQVDEPFGGDVETTWGFNYDNYNRLTLASENGGSSIYRYNALGDRVLKISGSNITKMLYNCGDCIADYNGNDVLQKYYITAMMDENMIVNESGSDYYFLQDGLGNVREIIDTSSPRVVMNIYDYEAFGQDTAYTTQQLSNRFMYTGRELDNETGLYYYRARMYDQTVGSFTGRDPVAAANLYSYCTANPVNFIDPTGSTIRTKCEIDMKKEFGVDVTGVPVDSYYQYLMSGYGQQQDAEDDGIVSAMCISPINFTIDGDSKEDIIKNLKRHITARKNIINIVYNSTDNTVKNVAEYDTRIGTKIISGRWYKVPKTEDEPNPYRVLLGKNANTLKALRSLKPKQYNENKEEIYGGDYLGCQDAAVLAMLLGIGQTYEDDEDLGGMKQFNKIIGSNPFSLESRSKLLSSNGVGGSGIANLSDNRRINYDNFWVPGDWGFVKNKDTKVSKYRLGENIIFLGEYKFWGHGVQIIKDLDEWKAFVAEWSNGKGSELDRNRTYPKIGLSE